MASIVDKCLEVVRGRELEFIASHLGANGTISATAEELWMLIEGLAKLYPQQFIEAVGVFLHDYVEVA